MAGNTKGWALPVDPTEFFARIDAYRANQQVINVVHQLAQHESPCYISRLPNEILNAIFQYHLEITYGDCIDDHRKNDCCWHEMGSCIQEHMTEAESDLFAAIDNLYGVGEGIDREESFEVGIYNQSQKLLQNDRIRHYKAAWSWTNNTSVHAGNNGDTVRPYLKISRVYLKDTGDYIAKTEDKDHSGSNNFVYCLKVEAFLLLPVEDQEYHRILDRAEKITRLHDNHELLIKKSQKVALANAAKALNLMPLAGPRYSHCRRWINWMVDPTGMGICSGDSGHHRFKVPKDYIGRLWLADLDKD
ncbi:uncharacterized protein KY384_003970 [Bacidia gigantensis]|uniref:uncharacterized protein n=1 Tax=Bacidia gigantensis TaxID=2732470 RepID=UPI001D054C4C|nr:uncharacterized protein KY384_003970 [Bacidia gigantensis]KAG8532329.1 hypothetical protein KY384_003970 [Bacidia gigantensis]